MNSDQLAEIRPALREALGGGEDYCVTFEVSGDESTWIQFVANTLNCAHRRAEAPPLEALPSSLVSALGGIKIANWEARKFVTYEIGAPEVEPLARLIDSIFTDQLGCTPGAYHLDVRHEQL
jgi:hypothetical protein